MRYIRFTGTTDFYCSEYSFVEEVPEEISNRELDEMSAEYAMENAEQYEYLLDEEDEEAIEAYYDGASGKWEEISKEEYDAEVR